jgi:acyl carrier protein
MTNPMSSPILDKPAGMASAGLDPAFERELTQLCVSALNLEMTVDEIDPAAPLYDDGLGLDSIDILEIALVVSKKYGLQLRADDENNKQIFASLRSLAQHIQAHRTV